MFIIVKAAEVEGAAARHPSVPVWKERHYAGWLDLPLPALCGMTPREAVRTKEGKDRVDVLLKDLENHECRLPEEERFSFSGMRRELGLDG